MTRLRGVTGAIDLASIMVGVLIIAVLMGIIATSIFGVIPWSQDAAARANLAAVKEAESVAKVQHSKFLPTRELAQKKLMPDVGRLQVATDDEGTCFVAASQSATGKVFYLVDDSPVVRTTAPPASLCVAAPEFDDDEGANPGEATGSVEGNFMNVSPWSGVDDPYGLMIGRDDDNVDPEAEPYASGFPWAKAGVAESDDVTDIRVYVNGVEVEVEVTYEVVAYNDEFGVAISIDGVIFADGGYLAEEFRRNGAISATIDGIPGNTIYYGELDGDGSGLPSTPPDPSTLQACMQWKLAAASQDGSKLLATTWDGTHNTLHVSTNGGSTWTVVDSLSEQISSGAIDVSASADGRVMAVAIPDEGVFISTDAGSTWTNRVGAGQQMWSVEVSGDGATIIAGAEGWLRVSTDTGATWSTPAGVPQNESWNNAALSSNGSVRAIGTNTGRLFTYSAGTWRDRGDDGVRGFGPLTLTSDGSKLSYQGEVPDSSEYRGMRDVPMVWDLSQPAPTPYEVPGFEDHNPSFVAISPDGSYALQVDHRNDGIWGATIPTANWKMLNDSYTNWSPVSMSSNGQTVIAIAGSYAERIDMTEVMKSTDGGSTWTSLTPKGVCRQDINVGMS